MRRCGSFSSGFADERAWGSASFDRITKIPRLNDAYASTQHLQYLDSVQSSATNTSLPKFEIEASHKTFDGKISSYDATPRGAFAPQRSPCRPTLLRTAVLRFSCLCGGGVKLGYSSVYIYIYIHMYVCIYIVHVCICIYVYVYIYIYICIK